MTRSARISESICVEQTADGQMNCGRKKGRRRQYYDSQCEQADRYSVLLFGVVF